MESNRIERIGSGLLIVIMLVALFATVAVISIPTLIRAGQIRRVQQTAAIFDGLRMAIAQFPAPAATYPEFRHRIGENLLVLSHLTKPITAKNAKISQTCGGTQYANNDDTQWAAFAPFYPAPSDSGVGINTPMGLINDLTVFSAVNPPTIAGTSRWIILTITTADLAEIKLLDGEVDGGDGAAAGFITWDTITSSTAQLHYRIATDNSC